MTFVIGITGEIASDKTTAAKFLKKNKVGFISTDKIVHSILQLPEIRERPS